MLIFLREFDVKEFSFCATLCVHIYYANGSIFCIAGMWQASVTHATFLNLVEDATKICDVFTLCCKVSRM